MQTFKALACYRDEKIELTGEACLRVWMSHTSLSTVYAQNPSRRAFVGPLGLSFLLFRDTGGCEFDPRLFFFFSFLQPFTQNLGHPHTPYYSLD